MFDSELKYCLACGDEYRQEFETCAQCGEKLVSGVQVKRSESLGIGENQISSNIQQEDPLVPLQRGSMLEMKNLKRSLERNGVPSLIISDEASKSGCCGGPEVLLLVRVEDLEKGDSLLKEIYTRTTHVKDFSVSENAELFNPFSAQTTCPACGHTFQPNRQDCPECGLFFC